MRARRTSLACLTAVCGLLGATRSASAEPLRLHGTAAVAKATGGHQKDEFGFGVAGFGAGELPLSREIGLQLELGALWLSEGDPPSDPTIAPEGDASAYTGGIGVRARPFASAYAADPMSAAGFWVSAAGGVAQTGSAAVTGSRTRGMFDLFVGYDLLYRRGTLGIGPTLGYLHVFQPDEEFRPADANIVLFGVHAMFDTATPKAEGDRDGDGIRDSLDRCPDNPEDKDGFEDQDGCPDNDNDKDGIDDSSDRCPNEPEDKDGFEDDDGCPETDNDKDGLLDQVDKCPNEPEDKDGFEDEDGCPEKDNDKDGIPDTDDLCPNEPETKNNYADHDGCPDEEQVRVVGDKIVLDDRVHFRTNSHIIMVQSYPLLERLSKLVKEHPEYKHIDIEGHADERGAEGFNQKLSENRARSVLEFMVSRGVEKDRLSSKGFGTTVPLVDKSSEHAWLMNRRVEFRVTREMKVGASQATPAPMPPSPGAATPESKPAETKPAETKPAETKPAPKSDATKPAEPKPAPKSDAPKAPEPKKESAP